MENTVTHLCLSLLFIFMFWSSIPIWIKVPGGGGANKNVTDLKWMAQNSNNNDYNNNDNRSIGWHIKKKYIYMSTNQIYTKSRKEHLWGFWTDYTTVWKVSAGPSYTKPNTKEAAVWERKATTLDGNAHCIQSLKRSLATLNSYTLLLLHAVIDQDEDDRWWRYGRPFRFETTWQGRRPRLLS